MTCLVVGVGGGLGLAVARRFGAAGLPVAAVARSGDALEERVGKLSAEGIQAVAIAEDIADPGAPARIVGAARDAFGPIDVLIYNCAAIGRERLPTAIERTSLQRSLEVNVFGALVTAQLVADDMRARAGGTMLFTSGTWAVTPSASHAALGLAKAAQRNLVLSLAEELAPAAIHVTTVTITAAIEPGSAHSPERLAELYWDVHCQPPAQWTAEVTF
jgi:NAD(P)-dependent dehydrogenase (short-subunit alcohol dehydrogenase family)